MSKKDKKRLEVYKYSNPNIVFDKANKVFNNYNFDIDISTRKNKKYMIRGDFTEGEWVHFGQMGYEDFTKHNDEIRQDKFHKRNNSWIERPINSPAFLSYVLLW